MNRIFKAISCCMFFILIIGLCGASYQKTRIVGIDPSIIEVYIGSNIELPKRIKVKYNDGKTSFIPVKWDKENTSAKKAGIFVRKGTVKDYEGNAILIYHVIPYLVKDAVYSVGQLAAMNNCLIYINKNFSSRTRPINKQAVDIFEGSSLLVKEYVYIENKQYKRKPMDSKDWVISIGNTSLHDFFVLVCDSETYEVLGFLPIA